MMKYRLFQYPLPAPPELEDLNAYLATQRVATVSHYVTSTGTGTLLVFVVQSVGGAPARGPDATPKIDYREQLSAEQFAVFSRLRDERKKWAEAEGQPVYTVFSNAHLATMVKCCARTLADLQSIEGIGPARIEKYGPRLLALLGDLTPRTEKPGGGGT